jgi:N,N-dimethylformamidase
MTDAVRSAGDPDEGAPIGYLPRWSYRPSDRIDVHVSCSQPWEADIVRLGYGDPRPDGTGLTETPIGAPSDIRDPLVQPTYPGSMAWCPVDGLPTPVAIVAWVRPTRPARGQTQPVLGGQTDEGRLAWGLGISPDARWQVLTNGIHGVDDLTVAQAWHLLQLVVDPRAGLARLTIKTQCEPASLITETGAHDVRLEEVGFLAIGGAFPRRRAPASPDECAAFDGVVAEPCLVSRALSEDELEHIRGGTCIADVASRALLATWTFPPGAAPVPVGPAADGAVILRNIPAAAMPGPHGSTDALHCHADDMTDAGWPIGVHLSVPSGTRSGVYAMRLRSEAGCDRIPFIVRPGAPSDASALLLLPTMTYLAYANEQMPGPEHYLSHLADQVRPGLLDRWLARHPEYGFSVYDRHGDGSGVNYSSLRRPIPNIRPDYLHWVLPEPRHLGGDLFLVDWLDRTGIAYDVACDHDLDDEGFALLEPYSVILTGSHPEYYTKAMLDALEQHLDRSGRVMYLGANGFYWVTSTSLRDPGTIEVRRGPNGYPWQSGEAESTQAFDGMPGGFWNDRGRPAQKLVGVRFIAMGADEQPAPGYQLRRDLPPSQQWIVDGIEIGSEIGTKGRLLGGAAGHELDCVDATNGLPHGVTIIASSAGHGPGLEIAPDRVAEARDADDAVTPHADLVLYRRPKGGIVFSTGSICWCGSLAESGGDAGIQRLTENVLREFSKPLRMAPRGLCSDG